MNQAQRWAALLVVLLLSAGCSNTPRENAGQANQARQSEPALPPPQAAPPPEAAPPPPTVSPERSEQRAATEEATPSATTGTMPQKPAAKPATKPAAPQAARVTPKDVVVLKGSPMGGVRLEHKKHAERAGNKCETCHHASKPQKPAAAPQQACSSCHTRVAAPPMKTKLQAAFHNPAAQGGTCIGCHKAQNAKGKKAPVKCAECHRKEYK